MGKVTGIAWTNHTFNVWWGCTKVGGSPACDGCYAERDSKRYGFNIWGDHTHRRYFGEKHFDELLKWDSDARKAGEMRRVFVSSMCDWAEGRPEQAAHLLRLWYRFLVTRSLIFLMLTKRPQLINKLCPLRSQRLWHGVTAENQSWLDLRWPILRDVDTEVYWLSIEPLLGPMNLPDDFLRLGKRAWCIVGGESGPKARPIHPEWVRRLRDQCVEAGVPYFMKQWGEWAPRSHGNYATGDRDWGVITRDGEWFPKTTPWNGHDDDGTGEAGMVRVGKKLAGHLLDGREWREVPAQNS